jgi:hypothetical protein
LIFTQAGKKQSSYFMLPAITGDVDTHHHTQLLVEMESQWNYHIIFILYLVHVIYYICWFAYVESFSFLPRLASNCNLPYLSLSNS